jgi:hypothetical protein
LRGAGDFDQQQGTTKLVLSQEIHLKQTDPQVMSFTIKPREQLGVSPGDKIHLIAELNVGWHRRKIALPIFTFDAWSTLRKHWLSASLIVLVLLIVSAIFLVFALWPLTLLSLYRHSRVYSWAQHKGNPFILTLLSATLLPFLITRRRVLKEWVRKHLPAVRRCYSNEPTVAQSSHYAALSLKVQQGQVETFIETAEIDELAKYFVSPRIAWEIVGVGGAGKTSLASEIGRKATFARSQGGLAKAPVIPVLIETDTSDLLETVREKLQSWTGEVLETDILVALLEQQYILVIVDGLSERSVETQTHVRTIYGKLPVNALVITSRMSSGMSGAEQVSFYPVPLDSKTLMYFIGFKLSQGDQQTAFAHLKDQLLLASKVARLIPTTLEESVVTPLLVTLFIEEAARLTIADLDNISRTIPDVYFNYLRRVNPQDATAADHLPNDLMQPIAAALARAALEKDFTPRELRKSRARRILQTFDTKGTDCIHRLTVNGVIRETTVGLDSSLRFVLDPMAEFLAAWAFAEECGDNEYLWSILWNKVMSSKAPGFKMALFLVHKTFGRSCNWPSLPSKVTARLSAET